MTETLHNSAPTRFTFTPYSAASFSPDALHKQLVADAPKRLAYHEGVVWDDWAVSVRDKLTELLAMPDQVAAEPNVRFLGETRDCGEYERQELIFEAEPGATVPCVLLLPKDAPRPLPVMICLQGHTTGMHISLGEVVHDVDLEHISGDRDFALQAVRRGYAALAVEQRSFGLRGDERHACCRRTHDLEINDDNRTCKHTAMTALLVGRTLMGERVFDIIRTCDAIEAIPDLDAERIHVMGNSGGGTVAWYASALEPRLKGAIVASCFATFSKSIAAIDHCTDNYVPGMLDWFDFPDIAAAITTSRVSVVMGRHDHLFPFEGVQNAFEIAKKIFEHQGRGPHLDLVIGEGGHRFYEDQGWASFEKLMNL